MKQFSKGTLDRFRLHVLEGKTSLEVFSDMFNELQNDLQQSRNDALASGSQYHRRIYVRTLLSFTEAMLFRLKEYLIDQSSYLKISLTQNEELMLHEQEYIMTQDGFVSRQPLMPSHNLNLSFTLRFLSRQLEISPPDFGSKGAQDYKAALNKRNSLTHPKFPDDLKISDDEIEIIRSADNWLEAEIAKVMNGFASKAKAVNSI